ncbi:MAG: tetraacyldisaccharide 4'-kinase [Rikenellaceae bacterium]
MLRDIIFSILSWIYGFAIHLRHKFFDWGIIKSFEFDIPIICIGNITVGGTGKTPMTEMIVNFMSKHYNVAVLSRGYGRRTKGYIEVDAASHYRDVGDEPLQIKLKFPDTLVVVCEKRVEGIQCIMESHPEINLIIMDDGFQHRHVEPKINVVMVDATRPTHEDHMLPLGNLRDHPKSLHRAHYFIVTKCPENMTPLDRRILRKVLVSAAYQEVYFTRFESFRPVSIFPEGKGVVVEHKAKVIGMAGVGNPAPFFRSVSAQYDLVDKLVYNDHHIYRVKDINAMSAKIKEHPDSIIITTEKDAVKMMRSSKVPDELRRRLFYIPVNIAFIDDSRADFLQKLKQDVREN